MKKYLISFAAIAAILLALGFWQQTKDVRTGRADATDSDLVDLGRGVYANSCASCHGANLEGQPDWRSRDADGYLPAPPHDETGHSWHHDDALLFKITKEGTASIVDGPYKTHMNGFGESLSDREIWAVLSYIKSTWPKEIRDRQTRLNERKKK